MKGGVGSVSKRRWKILVIPVVGLVFLSMMVPLIFVLGIHNGFLSAGYGTEPRNPASVRFSEESHPTVFDQHGGAGIKNKSKVHESMHVGDSIRRLPPTLPKDFRNDSKKSGTETDGKLGLSMPVNLPKQVQKDTLSVVRDDTGEKRNRSDESQMMCELQFGSYCLWRQEHRGKVEDAVVKRMKDLLYVARAYYPSIAKLPAFDKLSREMKQNIQDFERVLSEATTDKDLPRRNENMITKMESVIAKAKSCHVDCNNVDNKFRQLVDITEDESNFHMKQSAFLYQLAVHTMPKSLHCLSMRLTVESFRSSFDIEQHDLFLNPEFYHFIIFSRNTLASSVVINSTVLHAKESEKMVFHLLTDGENYFAMKYWFSINKYQQASVQVLNIEELTSKMSPLRHLSSWPQEFRVSFRRFDKLLSAPQIRTEYLSMFSHSHYLIPILFPSLEKVVVLDDDIVVQRDLSPLWDIDMGDKVNGAMQFCAVKLVQLKNYFSKNSFDEHSCAWTSGVNIIDLSQWRVHNLTEKFQRLVQQLSSEDGLSEASSLLSASLLTFKGLVYSLEDRWMLSGLGYNYGLNLESLKTAAVLHFDGNMKPWLDLGIPKYKSYWRKYLNQQNPILNDCNINP